MKIFCIGSNIESYESLKYLVAKNCKIDTLITLPSSNNQNVSDYYDLHEFCKKNKINTIDTTNVNSSKTILQIKQQNPDYLFTLGWSQIFKEDFINCFSKFVVGTHPSKLPHGRGRAPLPWTILEELETSAVSFFKIDAGIDTGNLIFQRNFDIPKGTYVEELYAIVAKELGLGFFEIYHSITTNKTITLKKQNEEGATIRGKRTPSDGLIDFNQSTRNIEKLVRAVSKPYPGAYCYYKDSKICFWKATIDIENKHSGTIGQILRKGDNGLLIQFEDGTLWLNEPTNDQRVPIELKFFRIGDKLGYNIQDELFNIKQNKQC